MVNRRGFVATSSYLLAMATAAGRVSAEVISSKLPWAPNAGAVIKPVDPTGPLQYLTAQEAALVDAIADVLIPKDEFGPGGAESGCTIFIDRQLAGDYGKAAGLYMQGPFPNDPLPSQGIQFGETPQVRYRKGLKAFDEAVRKAHSKSFAELTADQRASFLGDCEAGKVSFGDGVKSEHFFELLLDDVQTGFFADPIYGGNKDMVSWKLIGFPGARYDFRDWIHRHNEPYPYPPVSLAGRKEWKIQKG